MWKTAESAPTTFKEAVDVPSPAIAQVLWNRGLRTKQEVQDFLAPSWDEHVHDPKQFRHMARAIERIFAALEAGERITVHGDYDADGVTGSTVLITTLREIEKRLSLNIERQKNDTKDITIDDERSTINDSRIDFYIPHRDKEGYGLHTGTVPKLKDRSTKLIITVDCGIACVDEIALAKQEQIDTIVVDHHQFGETLPDGYLIHPGLPEESYPFKKLAAVGVAYKFACALLEAARARGLEIPAGWEKWLLDLVAIATVTDIVPLIGENRVLEMYGLKVLNKTRRPGLRALIEASSLEYGKMDTESIGFALGPRINAAGRMDHAELALRLMLAETEDEAKELAKQVERCNRERQETTKKMMVEAEEQLRTRYDLAKLPHAITLWDATWSPALVGLVAGKLLERFSRPITAIGQHEGTWIGSGRSIPAFDITQGVRLAGEGILTRAGGHVQACGFALIDEKRLPDFATNLANHAQELLSSDQLVPTVEVDAEIPLDFVDMSLAEDIERLAPFGEGNRRPIFVSKNVRIAAIDLIGAGKNHLRLLLVTPRGRRVKALGFKLGERVVELSVGAVIDLVYTIAINEWNGRRDAECRLIDFKICT